MPKTDTLSRREREMMNIIFARGRATATEVMDAMDDPPTYSAVRAALRVLEQKGHLKHQHDGAKYVYLPTVNRDRVRLSALDQLLATFFDGSAANVVGTLSERQHANMTGEALHRRSTPIGARRK